MEQLRQLGARSVPVVALGTDWVFAQDLGQVAELLTIAPPANARLPAAELASRLPQLLAAAPQLLDRIPVAQHDDHLPNRPRSLRSLANHIVAIAEGFADVQDGAALTAKLGGAEIVPPLSCAELGQRAAEIAGRLRPIADGGQVVSTYYGDQTIHAVLERTCWHMAQHSRQLVWVMGQRGLHGDDLVPAGLLSGLPLPTEVWDS